jgi:hypothetical protein
MSERIDELKYDKPIKRGVKQTKGDVFYNGPGEFLCITVAESLSAVPEFKQIFGEFIDGYKRMDYSERSLPALRIYTDQYSKEFDSWFIDGDITMDLIWPANIRRLEHTIVQDTLVSALIQQFRRPGFFDLVEQNVPGLNELGKRVTCNKALGYEFEENVVPLTQITLNFRIDLREWDSYLESTGRTKESPFDPVLAELTRINTVLQGLRDSKETEVEIPSSQRPGVGAE